MRKNTYDRWAIVMPGTGSKTRPDLLLGTYTTGMTRLFQTREAARQDRELLLFNDMLRHRPDLRRPPHNWRAYRPVKVRVTVEQITA